MYSVVTNARNSRGNESWNMPESDLCAVCLDPLEARAHARMPGCDHPFHLHCMLTWVQYDPRCPVCRAVPAGVTPRPKPPTLATLISPGGAFSADGVFPADAVVIDLVETESTLRETRLARQRYTARRRRALRADPRLAEDFSRLCALQRELNVVSDDASREYARQCRELWRTHPAILSRRRHYEALRRRERVLARRVMGTLAERIGDPPAE